MEALKRYEGKDAIVVYTDSGERKTDHSTLSSVTEFSHVLTGSGRIIPFISDHSAIQEISSMGKVIYQNPHIDDHYDLTAKGDNDLDAVVLESFGRSVLDERVKRRETVPVFLSDKLVIASEAGSVIPEGFRQATLNEVGLRYRYDAGFRVDLYLHGPAFTSQVGLESREYTRISDLGTFDQIDRDTYLLLPQEKKSLHHSGSGPVAVNGSRSVAGLHVDARFRSSDVARVAYVKMTPEEIAKEEAAKQAART